MAIVYLGIGSNVGNREVNCKEVVICLNTSKNIVLKAQSKFYLTKPVGGPPQEDYLNGIVKIETELSPLSLFNRVKTIERDMGRKDTLVRNSPRIIDIDILLYDNLVIETNELTIPHPCMHKRSFVLKGLDEIAPEVVHPALGKTIAELYKRFASSGDTLPDGDINGAGPRTYRGPAPLMSPRR